MWEISRVDQIAKQQDRQEIARYLADRIDGVGLNSSTEKEEVKRVAVMLAEDPSDDNFEGFSRCVRTYIARQDWMRLKDRFRRYRHRKKNQISSIQIREGTLRGLEACRRDMGSGTFDEVIQELIKRAGGDA